jgi:hypothetical protein
MRLRSILSRVSCSSASQAVLVVVAAFALLGFKSLEINPESARLAPDLPLADLHFHPQATISPAMARQWMDRNGVRWIGGGAKAWKLEVLALGRAMWTTYARELGDRFIPIGGMTELNVAYRLGGIAGMEDADDPVIKDLLRISAEDLKAGRIKAVGTVFINNSRSHSNPAFRRKAHGDASSVRRLYRLVAEHGAVLVVHMHPDADSLAQFEPLMAADRRARVMWSQCGTDTTASQLRGMLDRHPNLFCELSWRYPPVTTPDLKSRYIFDATGPTAEWHKLIEDHPDRFVIGNDGETPDQYDGAIAMVRKGLLPYLSPETARMVAYKNAVREFGLK